MEFLSNLALKVAPTLAEGLFGDSGGDDGYWNQKAFEATERWNQLGFDLANRQFTHGIRTRVRDARRAGIHPLYALGSAGSSPSFVAGQHPTGSGLGTGSNIAGRLAAAAAGAVPSAVDKAQVELLNAQRDFVNEQRIASETKRAEQAVGSIRPAPPVEGVRTIPYTERPLRFTDLGPPRHLEVEPDRDMPMSIRMRDEQGNIVDVLNFEGVGADEATSPAGADMMRQVIRNMIGAMWRSLPRRAARWRYSADNELYRYLRRNRR